MPRDAYSPAGYDRDEAVTFSRGAPRTTAKATTFHPSRPVSLMRELERDSSSDVPACRRLAIIGRGRLGTAFAVAFDGAGYEVDGPLGRGATGAGAGVVLLCVPDAEIARAATALEPGPIIGHCSGASGLDA